MRAAALLGFSLAVLLAAGGCALGPERIDKIPPVAVTLTVEAVTDTSVTLTWIAPGDDGTSGTATLYQLKYRTPPFTPAGFDSLNLTTFRTPLPQRAGSVERVEVTGLLPLRTYGFAIRTADNVPNWSALSPVVEATTASSSAPDRRWYVPEEVATIQAAIDSSGAADTVIVRGGVYLEHDIRMKSGVILRGEPVREDSVVVDAGGAGSVFICTGADSTTAISKLIIRGGAAANGAGIACLAGSSPQISECVFTGNSATARGGGLYCEEASSPRLSDCIFRGNSADTGGGACCALYASPRFESCSFIANTPTGSGGALASLDYAAPVLTDCDFRGNAASGAGGALWSTGFSSPGMTRCTFAGNTAGLEGGAFACASGATLSLTSCTLFENSAPSGAGFSLRGRASAQVGRSIVAFTRGGRTVASRDSSIVIFSCSDLFGNEAGDWTGAAAGQDTLSNNQSEDPAFCGTGDGRFTIRPDSPCNSGPCGLKGAWPADCGTLRREP